MVLFQCGEKVFVPSKEHGWEVGTVEKQSGDAVRVTLEDDGRVEEYSQTQVVAASEESLGTHDNLTSISELQEPIVLLNLRKRYQKNCFYTYIGPILIAVNPYRKLGIYSAKHIEQYRTGQRDALPPHVFAIAQEAYRALRLESMSQSILVSGESGAGKTETTRLLLQHLAVVSGQNNIMTNLSSQILEANPVLEAFGNAKTLCNDNSSRFGKFVKVIFGMNGDVVGGIIEQYLLETTRVVAPNAGERNYHIFYQLLAGCTEKERQAMFLDGLSAKSFSFLRSSVCPTEIDGVDDKENLQKVRDALKTLGFEEKEVLSVLRVAAAVLHVGNVTFTPGERTKVKNPDVLQSAAKLFGVEPGALSKALTNRGFQGGNRKSALAIALTGEEAAVARDGFAKAIYTTLFEWLVTRINDTIKPAAKHSYLASRFIGLLDIFGFESFERNSLEQLLINAANETLQYQFNKVFFEHEQEEYKAEGLPWTNVKFRDNTPCVELLEAQGTGILRMLCEEGRLPQCSDERLLSKMHTTHKTNKFYGIPRKDRDAFEVKHFARSVTYEATGFLEKNKDTVVSEVVALVEESSSRFLRAMFESRIEEEQQQATATGSKSPTKSTLRQNAGKRKPTVTERFLRQLASLSDQLEKTHRHYVRCIRPNRDSRPAEFQGAYALEQMLSSGVMETIMIRKAGFGHRILFSDFANTYRMLLRTRPSEQKEVCKQIVSKKLETGTYELGRSKVFLHEDAKAALDAKLEQLRKKAATLILRAMLRSRLKTRMDAFVEHAMKEKKRREEEEKRRKAEEEKRRKEEERRMREEEELRRKEQEERERKEKKERQKKEAAEREERERREAAAEEERKRKEAFAAEVERKRREEAEAAEEEAQRKEQEKERKQAAAEERKRKDEELKKRAQSSLGKTAGQKSATAAAERDLEESKKLRAELRLRAQTSMGKSAGLKAAAGEDADEELRKQKAELREEAGRRRGVTGSLTPGAERKNVGSLGSSGTIRAKSSQIVRSFEDLDVEVGSTGSKAFTCCDALLTKGAQFVTALKANQASTVARSIDSMLSILAEFLADAPNISDTRTFARACSKVEDQTKALVARLQDAIAATTQDRKAMLDEIDELQETLLRVGQSWKQTALALGKNLKITPSPTGKSKKAHEEIPSAGKEASSQKDASPRKASSPRPVVVAPLLDFSSSAYRFSVSFSNDSGEQSTLLCSGAETATHIKQVILERLGKEERQASRFQVQGNNAVLVISDESEPLEKVSWIATCLRVGVVPELEFCKRNEAGNDDKTLARWLRDEEKTQATLAGLLGPLFAERIATRLRTEASRMKLGTEPGSALLYKALGSAQNKAKRKMSTSGNSSKWFTVAVVSGDSYAVCSLLDGSRVLLPETVKAQQQPARLLALADLPPSAVLLVRAFSKAGDKELGWCKLACVDGATSKVVSGRHTVRLWTDGSHEMAVAASQNLADKNAPTVELEFADVDFAVSSAERERIVPPEMDASLLLVASEILSRPECGTFAQELNEDECHVLWECRLLIAASVSALPPFVRYCVDWAQGAARRDAELLLHHWAAPSPVEAIALLGPAYTLSPAVRSLACGAFDPQDKNTCSWLPLLARALRFEGSLASKLHELLLSVAQAGPDNARALFWSLYSDVQSAAFAAQAGFLCDLILRAVDSDVRDELVASVAFVGKLVVALNRGRPTAASDSLPRAGGLLPFGNSGAPSSSASCGGGSGLLVRFDKRQSVLVLPHVHGEFAAAQLVRIMHSIWSARGRDLGAPLGNVVCIGDGLVLGMHAVPEAAVLLSTQKDVAGFLDQHNKDAASRTAARQLLSSSVAALCVTSFVLGDCRNDSVYLLPSGAVYQTHHAMAGSLLDDISRFVITPALSTALGQLQVPTVQLAARAYSVLRKNAWILSGAMALLSGDGGHFVEVRLKLGLGADDSVAAFSDGIFK
jgi:myosin heavy subunit